MRNFFKKRLQLASFVPIHALVLAVELSDPELLPHCQEHRVLIEGGQQEGEYEVVYQVQGVTPQKFVVYDRKKCTLIFLLEII